MQRIRAKILKSILEIICIAMCICILGSAFAMYKISSDVSHYNTRTRLVSSESSAEALVIQAREQAVEFTDFCAQTVELEINSMVSVLNIISGSIADIYENPDEYEEKAYNHVFNCPADYCMQWILPENIQMEGDIRREAYLLGNIESSLKNSEKEYSDILSIYITTESGINIGYDNTAKSKPAYFDGRTTEWYTKVKETGDVYISQVYKDSFDRGIMITIAVPCRGEDDKLHGVVGMDLLIENLNDILKEINVGEDGYAMLISPDMMICADGITEENERDFENFLGSSSDDILKGIINKENNVVETIIDNKNVYAVYTPIGVSDWSIVSIIPQDKIIEPSVELSNKINEISEDAEAVLNRNILLVIIIWFIVVAVLLVLIIKHIGTVADAISNPIMKLCSDIEKIGTGNLDYTSDIHTGDEVEILSQSFEKMTVELQNYIDNFEKVTSDKQRIETELSVAKQIQASVLPCIFPAFPARDDFDIFAVMTPAKEVGGDFYDFYLIGENKLGIIMADVSGKGVPAALFMMISKALIKNLALEGLEVNEIFETANNQLNENNDTFMFVTAFMAVINLETGVMDYVNAGHNPPLLRRADNSFEWLDMKKNCILAVMPEMKFEKQTIQLNKNDILFTYTDGVTEAVNTENNFYGEPKLYEELNKISGIDTIDIDKIVSGISQTIDDFANGAPQADDITMLVFKYIGK